MTGISHLNILVQQGGNVQELQQIKQQSAEHTQTVAAQDQIVRAAEAKARVQESEESETAYLKRDKSKEKKDGKFSEEEKKKQKKKEEKGSASTGKILDTVA
jgi:hypothetical protein